MLQAPNPEEKEIRLEYVSVVTKQTIEISICISPLAKFVMFFCIILFCIVCFLYVLYIFLVGWLVGWFVCFCLCLVLAVIALFCLFVRLVCCCSIVVVLFVFTN